MKVKARYIYKTLTGGVFGAEGSLNLHFYIELQRVFYGPVQRKMGGLAIIRLGVWQNFIRGWKSGYTGNMKGEGFVLGGVFVIGSGNQVNALNISTSSHFQTNKLTSVYKYSVNNHLFAHKNTSVLCALWVCALMLHVCVTVTVVQSSSFESIMSICYMNSICIAIKYF